MLRAGLGREFKVFKGEKGSLGEVFRDGRVAASVAGRDALRVTGELFYFLRLSLLSFILNIMFIVPRRMLGCPRPIGMVV